MMYGHNRTGPEEVVEDFMHNCPNIMEFAFKQTPGGSWVKKTLELRDIIEKSWNGWVERMERMERNGWLERMHGTDMRMYAMEHREAIKELTQLRALRTMISRDHRLQSWMQWFMLDYRNGNITNIKNWLENYDSFFNRQTMTETTTEHIKRKYKHPNWYQGRWNNRQFRRQDSRNEIMQRETMNRNPNMCTRPRPAYETGTRPKQREHQQVNANPGRIVTTPNQYLRNKIQKENVQDWRTNITSTANNYFASRCDSIQLLKLPTQGPVLLGGEYSLEAKMELPRHDTKDHMGMQALETKRGQRLLQTLNHSNSLVRTPGNATSLIITATGEGAYPYKRIAEIMTQIIDFLSFPKKVENQMNNDNETWISLDEKVQMITNLQKAKDKPVREDQWELTMSEIEHITQAYYNQIGDDVMSRKEKDENIELWNLCTMAVILMKCPETREKLSLTNITEIMDLGYPRLTELLFKQMRMDERREKLTKQLATIEGKEIEGYWLPHCLKLEILHEKIQTAEGEHELSKLDMEKAYKKSLINVAKIDPWTYRKLTYGCDTELDEMDCTQIVDMLKTVDDNSDYNKFLSKDPAMIYSELWVTPEMEGLVCFEMQEMQQEFEDLIKTPMVSYKTTAEKIWNLLARQGLPVLELETPDFQQKLELGFRHCLGQEDVARWLLHIWGNKGKRNDWYLRSDLHQTLKFMEKLDAVDKQRTRGIVNCLRDIANTPLKPGQCRSKWDQTMFLLEQLNFSSDTPLDRKERVKRCAWTMLWAISQGTSNVIMANVPPQKLENWAAQGKEKEWIATLSKMDQQQKGKNAEQPETGHSTKTQRDETPRTSRSDVFSENRSFTIKDIMTWKQERQRFKNELRNLYSQKDFELTVATGG